MKVVSETNVYFITFNWILFFLLGYMQWFILVPIIQTKFSDNKKIYSFSINRYILFFGIIIIVLYILAIFLL